MPLTSDVSKFMEALGSLNPPIGDQISPQSLREFSKRTASLRSAPETVAEIFNMKIPANAHEIPIRIYQPVKAQRLPILIYFHGGGHMLGSLETHDTLCRGIANRAQCLVVAVDYRLAPEHKFPADQDDCYAVTCWIAKHADDFRGDTSRIAVGGDSAGGNLAIQTCLRARDQHGPKICYQILIYPETDLSYSTASLDLFKEGYLLTKERVHWFHEAYFPGNVDRRSPSISPLLADKKNLPPALVITAEYDPIRDEGELFAQQLQNSSVAVTTKRYDGVVHGFIIYPNLISAAAQAWDFIGTTLRQRFAQL